MDFFNSTATYYGHYCQNCFSHVLLYVHALIAFLEYNAFFPDSCPVYSYFTITSAGLKQ